MPIPLLKKALNDWLYRIQSYERVTRITKRQSYIGVCINFDISCDILVLQLGIDISQKQLTLLRSRWCYSLQNKWQNVTWACSENYASFSLFFIPWNFCLSFSFVILVIQSAHSIKLQDVISRLVAVRTYATKHDRWCEKNDLQQAAIALINARIKWEGKNSALCIRKWDTSFRTVKIPKTTIYTYQATAHW